MATEFDEGMLIGVLVGEGHFGGDGKQPQVTLRMHTRHLALFRWIDSTFPGGRLYGPYNHDGRHYYQWMARGNYLRQTLLPILERRLSAELDGHSFQRFEDMKERYGMRLIDSDPSATRDDRAEAEPGAGGGEAGDRPSRPKSLDARGTVLNQASAIFDALRHNED